MLTPAQLQTLKAAINADPVLSAYPMTGDGPFDLALKLNTELAAPDYYVWKSFMEEREVLENGMNWTLVDGLTQGKRDEWNMMFKFGSVNPSKQNIRAGIIDVWSGSAPKVAVQLAIWGHASKLASRAERIFATGNGTAPVEGGTGPGVTSLLEPLTHNDVQSARNLP